MTRRPTTRELLTPESERLLAGPFAGQVRSVVIERALRRLAAADEKTARQAGRQP
ncbi:hypothetical protein QA811_02115 [Streptomyces sp. B21-102]|uniref:hypothetical protein n=1 Tax=Streptomyces sp. B21-102 TaxID=3039416 RepID=UPI002FF0329B